MRNASSTESNTVRLLGMAGDGRIELSEFMTWMALRAELTSNMSKKEISAEKHRTVSRIYSMFDSNAPLLDSLLLTHVVPYSRWQQQRRTDRTAGNTGQVWLSPHG